jgi:lysophospholipase L1-like esterase
LILPGPRAALRRALHDRRRRGAARSVALLGDSITSSCRRPTGDWFDLADPACRYRVVLNAGRGGSTIGEMRERLDPLLQAAPDICVVQGGGNDILAGRSAADVVADLESIYRTLRSAGIQPIATTVLPHGETPLGRLADVRLVNEVLLGRTDVAVCDWTAELVDGDGLLRRELADDRTHPNQACVAVMASCLGRVLKDQPQSART